MPAPIWLTTDEILETAREFKGWKYRFQLKDKSGQTAAPAPTFPIAFLDTYGSIFGSHLPGYQERARSDKRATNCVMFGEGLLVGTVARTGKASGVWDGEKHKRAMQAAGAGPKGVIQAYVDAGFAEKVQNGHEEEPGPWSIVQGDHHFWIVVDCVGGVCLTLEANVFVAPLSRGEIGFVGHNWSNGPKINGAWGKELDDEFLLTGTVNGFTSAGPTWAGSRKNNKELWFAKLYVRQPTRVFSPLSQSDATSAVFPGYSNNESKKTGHGGYYVFGLHRNLHGGIHLFPPRDKPNDAGVRNVPPTRVVAMANGYVVAARLPGPDAPARQDKVLNLLRNWPGFVLLRHEITVRPLRPDDKAKEPVRQTLYSLYMHLRSPRFIAGDPVTIPSDDLYLDGRISGTHDRSTPTTHGAGADAKKDKKAKKEDKQEPPPIPWFHQLYRARHGAWVRVRPEEHPPKHKKGPAPEDKVQGTGRLGEIFWSQDPVAVGSTEPTCRVYDGDKALVLRVRDDKGPIFVHKRPPAKLVEAVKDLMDGKVVTFAEPLFPVRAREGVGYVSSLPQVAGVTRSGREVPDGFLHFQVFAPKGKPDAVNTLIDKVTKLIPGLQMAAVECMDGNFLELGTFKRHVEKPIIDPHDKQQLELIFQDFVDRPDLHLLNPMEVVEMLDDKVSFAAKDKKWETEWNLDGHCYPVRLDIEVPYLPDAAAHTTAAAADEYRLALTFRDANRAPIARTANNETTPAKITFELVIDQAKLRAARPDPTKPPKPIQIVIQVPAEAESVEVAGATDDIDAVLGPEDPQSEEMLFKDTVAGRRWRDVKLSYANEWSLAEMEKAVDAIYGTISPSKEYAVSKSAAQAFAWCDKAKEAPVRRVFLKDGAEADEERLFDDAIPPAGPLVCLHPMTAVWMLAMLGRNDPPTGAPQEKVVIEGTFDSKPHGGDRPPAWWSWVAADGVKLDDVSPGDRLWVVIVDDDYSYDDRRDFGPDDKRNAVEMAFDCGGKSPKLRADHDGTRSGMAKAEVVADWWGTCKLSQARGGAPDVFDGGSAEATVKLEPTLAEWTDEEKAWGFAATRRRAQRFAFVLKLAPSAPKLLNGYAWIEWRKLGDEAWTPGERYELAQARSFAHALAQTQEARRKKRKAGSKPLEVTRTDFLPETGELLAKPKDPKKTKLVTASASWQSYVEAYTDIVLACSLADAIEALAEALKPDGVSLSLVGGSLARDGKSCTVLAQRPKAKKKTTPPPKEPGALVVEKAAGVSASDLGKGQVKLSLAGGPAPIDSCDRVKANAAALRLSPDRTLIHGTADRKKKDPRVTASFGLSRYQRAFDKSEIRVHENLAEGLELLRDDLGGKVQLEYVSLDGMTAHVSVPQKYTSRSVEAALEYFLGVSDLDHGKLLRVTAAPESDAYAFVTVDGTQLLQDVEAAAPDDGKLEYRFCFLPMALFHVTNKEQLIDKGRFDRLKGETLVFSKHYECPYPAGVFEQVGFPLEAKREHFKLRPGQKGCGLVLEIELRGDPAEWAHYQIVVTKNGKVETQKRLVGKNRLLSIDCGALATTTVKLEAVLRSSSDKPEDHPLPKPYEATYKHVTKLEGLAAEWSSDESTLIITATAESLAPPVLADAPDRDSWQYASSEEVAQALRLELRPAMSVDGKTRLEDAVEYLFRSKPPKKKGEWRNHGFCDRFGRFEARLAAAHVDTSQPLEVKLVAVPNKKDVPGLLPKRWTPLETTVPAKAAPP